MHRLPLVVAGIIFTLVALIHLARLIYDWQIIIAGYVVPMSASVVALVVTIIIALWMFMAASKN